MTEYTIRFYITKKYENCDVSEIKFNSSVDADNIKEAAVKAKKETKESKIVIDSNMNARIIDPEGRYKDILTNGEWWDDSNTGEKLDSLEEKLKQEQ